MGSTLLRFCRPSLLNRSRGVRWSTTCWRGDKLIGDFALLHIVLISVADLPEGGGRTSRLKTLAGALAANDQVFVLIEHALSGSKGQIPDGMFGRSKIPFRYVLGRTERRFGFAAAGMKIAAVIALVRWLSTAKLRGEVDMILLNNLALYDLLPLTLWARRHRIPTIQCYEDERLEVVSTRSLGSARRLFALNS